MTQSFHTTADWIAITRQQALCILPANKPDRESNLLLPEGLRS